MSDLIIFEPVHTLKEIRSALAITQTEMAEALEICLRQYQHFEKPSKPIPRHIHLAAFALYILNQHQLSKTPAG